jgi:predicted nucleic acid-binding protein
LNRPFDDQTQTRIRLESEAVTMILARIDAGEWEQVSSRMAAIEVAAIPNAIRRRRVLDLLPRGIMELTATVFSRARELIARGLAAADAVHVAAAESLRVDVFLTCDDRLLRRCERMPSRLRVDVRNPRIWLQEQTDATDTR